MANPEHLAVLKQGVKVWNRWREENSGCIVNLTGANLSRANLREADLCGAYLSGAKLGGADLRAANLRAANLRAVKLGGADLRGANLRIAYLSEADFSGAYLGGANLSGAKLGGANLSGANLRGANLGVANLGVADFSEANLSRANLSGAKLGGADLKNARCWETIFAKVDLSETKNLDSIDHHGPSTIGIDTLYKSKGNIPEVFLRGCGVPDQMIKFARSLTENYSCFISYSHKDEEFVKRLWEGLQAKNVRCWYAPHDMKIGDKIRPTIEESIRMHDKLLLIFSEHSMKSKWVKHEVENALDLEIEREKTVLFPVRVDDCVMDSEAGWANEIKKTRHIGDFTRWKDHDAYSKSFDRLLRDLQAG